MNGSPYVTTIRVAHRRRFTTIDQATVNDERLSFRARGVLAWLLDKADDWRCDSATIARAGTEGRDAIRAALTELEKLGYLVRRRLQDPQSGQFETVAEIRERPGHTEDGFPGVGKPGVGKPVVGEPVVGFPGALTKTENKDVEQRDSSSANNNHGVLPAVAGGVKKIGIIDMEENLRYHADFKLFWDSYGHVGPRQVAADRWLKAVRGGANPEDIQRGLERWVEYWQTPGAAKVKWPQGWLNEKRWQDEPPFGVAGVTKSMPSKHEQALDGLAKWAEDQAGDNVIEITGVRP
jgi:hypothetical protein